MPAVGQDLLIILCNAPVPCSSSGQVFHLPQTCLSCAHWYDFLSNCLASNLMCCNLALPLSDTAFVITVCACNETQHLRTLMCWHLPTQAPRAARANHRTSSSCRIVKPSRSKRELSEVQPIEKEAEGSRRRTLRNRPWLFGATWQELRPKSDDALSARLPRTQVRK